MWIRIKLLDAQPKFIAVCSFPPDTSLYAHDVMTEGHSPYETLCDSIMKFSRLGEILLLGHFNACTCDTHVGLLNFEEDPVIVLKIDPTEIGIVRHSANASHVTGYGHHLLELGAAHDLIIYNGLPRWPMSGGAYLFST